MINLLRRVRQQYLNEGSYRLYILNQLEGEQLWIDYLEGKRPYHDSLLNYCYYIGSTAY